MKITKRSSKDNDDNGENPPTDNNTYAHLSTENLITQNDDSKDQNIQKNLTMDEEIQMYEKLMRVYRERQRIANHEKIISQILEYTRTNQQQEKVSRKIKFINNKIEQLYENSGQNRLYKFPRTTFFDVEFGSSGQLREQRYNKRTGTVLYNLHKQSEIVKQPNQSEFLQLSRRVKSLEQVGIKGQLIKNKLKQNQRIKSKGPVQGRIQTDLEEQQNYFDLNPKVILNKRHISVLKIKSANKLSARYKSESKLPFKIDLRRKQKQCTQKSREKQRQKQGEFNQGLLPSLVFVRHYEKLKTQNQSTNKNKIQQFISKKLITESYCPYQSKSKRFSPNKGLKYFKKK